ncbi:MAG: hypothetical protein RLZ00_527 [Pseudomonadota bacterium]
MSHPLNCLHTLRQALADLRSNVITDRAFVQTAREQNQLFAALPPKFETVWLNLVDRLESSALFTEESCSFSQTDLFDSLAMVLDKAQAQLNTPH